MLDEPAPLSQYSCFVTDVSAAGPLLLVTAPNLPDSLQLGNVGLVPAQPLHPAVSRTCTEMQWKLLEHECSDDETMRTQSVLTVPTHNRRPDGSVREEGVGYPLVLLLHGGPHSASSACMRTEVLSLISLGYAVVTPNYRYVVLWFRSVTLVQSC